MILVLFMPVSSDGDVMKDLVKIFWWMFLILLGETINFLAMIVLRLQTSHRLPVKNPQGLPT